MSFDAGYSTDISFRNLIIIILEMKKLSFKNGLDHKIVSFLSLHYFLK